MKLIAQSEVPARLPYVHLGYTAATAFNSVCTGALMWGIGIVLLSARVIGKRQPDKYERLALHVVRWLALLFAGIGGGYVLAGALHMMGYRAYGDWWIW